MGNGEIPKKHPFLEGNYAPIQEEQNLQECIIKGSIPDELIGGQYVRNGGNPLSYNGLEHEFHWFDGHGMLNAVYFSPSKSQKGQDSNAGQVKALFSNRFILTDVYLAERRFTNLSSPIVPSLSPMINLSSPTLTVLGNIIRAFLIVIWSFWSRSMRAIKRISVVNTNIMFHGNRALAFCESGPPMRVVLPELTTVGWFDGKEVEGEEVGSPADMTVSSGFSAKGFLGFFQEWTTGHPHIDPVTGEMMVFHSSFIPPFIRYSVLAGTKSSSHPTRNLFSKAVPGLSSPKMMHDFGVSREHTIIIDMPLSLNPLNVLIGKPIISSNPQGQTRFGVLPRHAPQDVQWFVTDPCCIFHTVHAWEDKKILDGRKATVNFLACRMNRPTIVYSVGNLVSPTGRPDPAEDDAHLYYYQFAVGSANNQITQQWGLSAIQFDFPHVPAHLTMSATKFIYGSSVARKNHIQSFEDDLKISSLVKVNVAELISRGMKNPPTPVSGCVDNRTIDEIIASTDPKDPIQIFAMPEGYFAQECVFVPRNGATSEDDGYLLTFVFDEAQLDEEGSAPDDAKSEFWVIDAKNMKDVVLRVVLPQRVPYGLHGFWFSKEDIANQRPVDRLRT